MTTSTKLDSLILMLAEKGLSYAAEGIIWKSDLHPRDDYGKFAKKDSGVFTLLNDLTAGNYHGTSYQGQAGYVNSPDLDPTSKVGGAIITPPEGQGYAYSEHHVDWALKPGEKVYSAHSTSKSPLPNKGQTAVIVHHTDGSATVLMPTPEGEMPKVGLQSSHFSDMLAQLDNAGYAVDTDHPLDENLHEEAAKYDESIAEVELEKKVGGAPESAYGYESDDQSPTPGDEPTTDNTDPNHFQDIQDESGKHIGHVEKTPDGKYTSHDAEGNKIGNTAKHLHTAVEKVKSGKLTTPSTYEHKKPAKEAAKAEKAAEPSSNDHFQDIEDDAGKHIGHIEKTPEGKYTSHDSEGNKIGNTAKHLDTAVAKVHSTHEQNQTVADALGYNKPEPEPENKIVDTEAVKNPEGHAVGYVDEHADGTFKGYDNDGNLIYEGNSLVKSHYDVLKAAKKANEEPKVEKPVAKIAKKAPAKIPAKEKPKPELKEYGSSYQVSGGKGSVAEKLDDATWTSFDPDGNKISDGWHDAAAAIAEVKYEFAKNDSGDKQKITDANGNHIGHVEKTEEGKWASFDKDGNKLGYTISNLDKAVGKVHSNNGPVEEPQADYEWDESEEVPKSPETYKFEVNGHSSDIPLKPGDAVVYNKEFESGWVNHPDGSATGFWYDSDGELQTLKVGKTPVKSADVGNAYNKGWEIVQSVPMDAHVDEEPSNVFHSPLGHVIPLQKGEKLYTNGSGAYMVFDANGEPQKQYSSSVGSSFTKEEMPAGMANAWKTLAEKKGNFVTSYDANAPKAPEHVEQPATKPFDTGFGSTISMQPGDQVFQETPSTSFAVFDANGNLKAVYTSNGNVHPVEDSPNLILGWNKSFKAFKEGHSETTSAKIVATYDAPSVPSEPMTPSIAALNPKKKIKDSDLPNTIEIQNGNKLHAEPGGSLWANESGLHLKLNADGQSEVYGDDGKLASWLGGSKMSAAAAKKKGWTKIGQGGTKEDLQSLLPTVPPTKDFDTKSQAIEHAGYSGIVTALGYGSSYESNPFSESAQTGIAKEIANLKQAKIKFADDLEKSEKAGLTKSENNLVTMLSLSVLGNKLSSPDYKITESDETNFAELKSKADNIYNGYIILNKLNELVQNKKFEAGLKDLGFDLSTGSDEEFKNYAIANGANNIGGMTEQNVKDWVFSHLGKPNHYVDKADIEKEAGITLKYQAVAALAEQVNEKKLAMQVSEHDKLVAKAVQKQTQHEYAIASQLSTTYKNADGDAYLEYNPATNTFELYTDGDDASNMSPSQAKQYLAENPDLKATYYSSQVGDGVALRANQLHDSYSIPADEKLSLHALEIAKGENAVGSPYMTNSQATSWLFAHLRGDQVGKYEVEKEAFTGHGDVDAALSSHLGSPTSNTGAASRQALADFLNTQDWWTKQDNPYEAHDYSFEDLESAVKALDLKHAASTAGFDLSDATVLSNWLQSHKALPKSSQDIVKGDQTVEHGGKSYIVPENGFAAKSPNSDAFLIVKPDGNGVLHAGTGNNTVDLKYDNPATDFAKVLSGGWIDATPKWGQNAEAPVSNFKGLTPKPSNITQEAWDITAGAEAGGSALKNLIGSYMDADDEKIAQTFNSTSVYDSPTQLKLLAAPDNIKKLAAWAAKTYEDYSGDNPEKARLISRALKARAEADEYVPTETYQWKHPGTNTVFPLPAGSELFKHNSVTNNYAIKLESGQGFTVDQYGHVSSFGSHYNVNTKYTSIKKSPKDVSFNKAQQEGQEFTQSALDKVDEAEKQEVWNHPYNNEASAAWDFKGAIKQMPEGNEKYNSLTDKLYNFPVGIKQLAVESALHNDSDTLDALMWKSAKGSYDLQPTVVEHPLVAPDKSYSSQVANGVTSAESIYDEWTSEQEDDFISDYNLDPEGDYFDEEKSQLIAEKLTQLKAAQKTVVKPDPKNEYANLSFSPINKSYDGMHEKQGYSDQFGREWMSKYYNSDPNAQYRLDVEHYANVIGNMFGFNSAKTFVGQVDGRNTITQMIEDSDGDLSGYSPSDLHESQLTNVMKEHVLDWLISNHDSHYGNILRGKDGQSIIGIDKGQAFKFFPNDKLESGYLPPGNGAPVWYDQFYDGIKNGSISEETANKVAQQVLTKAYQVQTRYDNRFNDLIDNAFASRDFWPDEYPSRASFTGAIKARKGTLVSDFENLYKGLFKDAGYDWKIDTDAFGKKVGEASVQNNSIFAQDVIAAKGFGKALFSDSQDLEDHHLMVTHMKQSDGGNGLLMSAKLREDADGRVTGFMKSLFNGNLATGEQASAAPKPNNAFLPVTNEFYNSLVNYAKTVNTHAVNGGKTPDGQFNQGYVDSATSYAKQAKATLAEIDFARKDDPSKVVEQSSKFPYQLASLEQQNALFDALSTQLDQYQTISDAKEASTSIKQHDPDLGMIEPISYEPTPGLTSNAEARTSALYKLPNGEYAWKTSDGGHYFSSDADGSDKTWASATDFANAISDHNAEWVPAIKADAPHWDSNDGTVYTQSIDGSWVETASPHTTGTDNAPYILSHQELTDYLATQPTSDWSFHTNQKEETVVTQTNAKQLKVSHRKAAGHTGGFNVKTGMMEQSSNDPVESELHPGFEYTVEHGNVKIHYRPWTEPGVARTQQGLVSVEVKDWNGEHDQIDDVLDTLNLMGVNVSPADEDSLKLGYYRQMTNILNDRNDRQSGPTGALLTDVQQQLSANPFMSDPEQMQMYTEAWKKHMNVDPEKVDYLPHFNYNDQTETSAGRPFWFRPDINLEQLKETWKENTLLHHRLLISGVDYDKMEEESMNRAYSILASGKLLSTEERIRILNQTLKGASSSEDQTIHGSSAFVYTRQNSLPSAGHDSPTIFLHPEAALQHTNYAFSYDAWGDIGKRTNTGSGYEGGAPFQAKNMYNPNVTGDINGELLIKNEAPVAYMVVTTNEKRDELLSRLHAEGFTSIQGRALEEVLFAQEEWDKVYEEKIEKLWEDSLERMKQYAEGEK